MSVSKIINFGRKKVNIGVEKLKKLYKFDSMFFLKYLNGCSPLRYRNATGISSSAFSQLQWTPIAPSIRRKMCSSKSIIKFINQI